MDATMKKNLEDAGINVDEALERLLGNERLMAKVLKKFPSNSVSYYTELQKDLEGGASDEETKKAIEFNCHSLKGVCLNLSITRLGNLFTEQLGMIRNGDLKGAGEFMERIAPEYEKVISAIESNCQ